MRPVAPRAFALDRLRAVRHSDWMFRLNFSRRLLKLAARCAGAGIMCLAAAGNARAQQGGGPNIVYIMADDLGWADVGFHGPDIRTPNIDSLAEGGARLEAFYVLPVCTPTRSALMTGRYPIRYGRQFNVLRPGSKVGLSLRERLLPEALRAAGYATAICGKWHLGDFEPAYLPMQRGFEHQFGFASHGERFSHFPKAGDGLMRDQQPCADEGYLTDLITKEAVGWIAQHGKSGKPFFLYVAYHSPHTPLECPPEYAAPYAALGATRSVYAGMVAAMDEGIGRIISAIEGQGIRRNTLIIFNSDNGGLMTKGDIASNGPLRGGKGDLYEGGTRVAACANWQGRIPAGTVVHEPLHIVDWYPTLLKLAGGSRESDLPFDGCDIWPTIAEGKPSPHQTLLLNVVGRMGAIRVGNWKLLRNCLASDDAEGDAKRTKGERAQRKKERRNAPDVVELFNLAEDIGEKNNLAARFPERVQELAARLDVFAKEAVPPILK